MHENDTIQEVRAWQARTVADNAFSCAPIAFEDSDEWRFDDGQLRHRTGGFFSLAGIRTAARHPSLDGHEQLIIVQRQIAINGFVARRRAGATELLFQGRVEPGNIHGMQLAPTVQSTEANYRRLHGGGPTAFLEWFNGAETAETVVDELQSEEATRYHGKYNRNVVRLLPDGRDPDLPRHFRWYGMDALRDFVVTSHVLNTDARSVLSSVDWDFLAGQRPAFSGHAPGGFGDALRASYEARPGDGRWSTGDIVLWLTRLRVRAGLTASVLPLQALRDWVVDADRIRPRSGDGHFEARYFRVVATQREVPTWTQPLIDSRGSGRLSLVAQTRDGRLHFLVKASHEIGFLEGVQLSASVAIAPGAAPRADDPTEALLIEVLRDRASIISACRQSEEGGRFYQDVNDYEIAWIDSALRIPEGEDYRWITLAQLRELARIPGMLSIELRGVMALLLTYL